jgi:DNA-binding Lrp family transcriptional regulator
MKKHSGMRPQDIVILLRILSLQDKDWLSVDIARFLRISPSEVSESLNRSDIAGLIDKNRKNVNANSFKEFLIYGLKYVFPVQPGAIVRGIPTAHSAPPISGYISQGQEKYVWPSARGNERGQAVEPLYKTVPLVAFDDIIFYQLLVIADTLRIGRTREVKIAINELDKIAGFGWQ